MSSLSGTFVFQPGLHRLPIHPTCRRRAGLPGVGSRAFGEGAGERALAAVLLVLAAPVVLLAAALVKLTSRGPAFYSQVRLGVGGRPFTLWKIRTMTHDCERQTGPRWAIAGDPRVTPVGWMLRPLHLDELPQLWNVVRGEMSLVGPRPERPEFVARLERKVPRYRERMDVLPGLTGLAQLFVPPDTDVTTVRRKLRYDLHYIDRRAPGFDLLILFATALKLAGAPDPVLRATLQMPNLEADRIESWLPD